MFGIIDFTDFLGMDLSYLIDSIGGLFNFQIISLGLSLCCCCIIVSLSILLIKNQNVVQQNTGLFIPGIGNLGQQQPLIIHIPMQTKPYPFSQSSFPRDT
jgi:hypothetical protein